MTTNFVSTRAIDERKLDMTLAGSFPASDPPSWTLGLSPRSDPDDSVFGPARPAAIEVVIRDDHRPGGTWLAGIGEAIMMIAALPLAIVIAGATIIGVVSAITHVVRWVTGIR
jgi:hypothetical protein